jgi:hypothetical protein
MAKDRHIKTFEEKYGLRSIVDEYWATFKEHRKLEYVNDKKLFSMLPYLGYLYVDVNYDLTDFWYDSDLDRIRAKVIKVSHDEVLLSMIDDHNGGIATILAPIKHHKIKGNVLI